MTTKSRDMNRRSHIDPWAAASAVGLLALCLLLAAFGRDAGMIWDELLQAEYGDQVLAWFRSGFADRRALDYLELYLYGGLFEAPAQWIATRSPFGLYETRHLLSGACAIAGVGAVWLTARRIAGPRAAFFAAALLATTPAWIGHGLFNSKDIPFGAAAAFVTYVAVRIATGPTVVSWRLAFLSSVTVGAAIALRPGGIFVAAYPWCGALVWVGSAALHRESRSPGAAIWQAGRTTFARLLATLPVSWAIMLAAWPYAQVAPWSHPWHAIATASHYIWDGEMLFRGTMVRSTQLPWDYLPRWFAITTPELHVLAMLAGIVALCAALNPRRSLPPVHADSRVPHRMRAVLVVALTIAAPLAGVWWERPVLYDGLRHFLFLFPSFAILEGVGLSCFVESAAIPRWVRTAVAGAAGAALLLVVGDIVALHPYEYVYFNRASGGLSGAVGHYETDYWGASYKEGLAWTAAHLTSPAPGQMLRVSSCNDNSNRRLEYYRRRWPGVADRLRITGEYRDADVYLAITRYDCHKRPGEVLHVVRREGAPLLYVIRTAPR
jgi:hypothetical protein